MTFKALKAHLLWYHILTKFLQRKIIVICLFLQRLSFFIGSIIGSNFYIVQNGLREFFSKSSPTVFAITSGQFFTSRMQCHLCSLLELPPGLIWSNSTFELKKKDYNQLFYSRSSFRSIDDIFIFLPKFVSLVSLFSRLWLNHKKRGANWPSLGLQRIIMRCFSVCELYINEIRIIYKCFSQLKFIKTARNTFL